MDEVSKIVSELGSKKDNLLSDVRSGITSYISQCSPAKCMTFVLRDYYGENNHKVYEPKKVGDGYLKVLRKFIFSSDKKYQEKRWFSTYEYVIDSVLTDKIVEIVSSKFQNFYEKNTNIIAKTLLTQLLSNQTIRTQLANQLADDIFNNTVSTQVRKKFVAQIVTQLEDAINNVIVNATGQNISDLATMAITKVAAMNISTGLAAVILKSMLPLLKGVFVKIFATISLKSIFIAKIKGIVVAKVTAFLIAFLGPKLAALLGGFNPIGILIVGAVALFIRYEIKSLPSDMAEKVSVAVSKELNGHFDELNTTMIEQLTDTIKKDAGKKFTKDIAKGIADNPAFKDLLNQFI